MRYFLFILIFISGNCFAENGFGRLFIGFEAGKSKTTVLSADEESSTYEYYGFKILREININNYLSIDAGLGYEVYNGTLRYKDSSEFVNIPYIIDTGAFIINPRIKMTDRLSLGVFVNTFFKPIALSHTELSMVKFGANIYLEQFIFKRTRLGIFIDQTDGTTSRKIQTSGIMLQVGF